MNEEARQTSDFDSSPALLLEDPPSVTPSDEQAHGLTCEKCGEPMMSEVVAICRRCGWYASLGVHMGVDPDYEFEQQTTPQRSHLQVWSELIPWWIWVVFGSIVVVVAESIAARFLTTPEVGGLRTVWSLTQLAIGCILLFATHLMSFLVLAADDAEFGLLDIVLRPFKIWLRTFARLPSQLWLTTGAAIGVTSIAMSLLVIGAIPYDRLWDWGITPPPKQNLMGAVMDRVKKVEGHGAKNLEDAIGDFAGTADSLGNASPGAIKAAANRKQADCVILGYQVSQDGRLTQLLLGTDHLGKLVYAGYVTPQMSDHEHKDLLAKLASIRSDRPYLRVEASAIWVMPQWACRVTYEEKSPTGRLIGIQWLTLTGKLRN